MIKKNKRLNHSDAYQDDSLKKAVNMIANMPRIRFSTLPTPIHRLPRISERLGIDLWCKRDDLTGFAFGGNKNRKLEFLIADAKKGQYDTLLALGANQSNFCRMAAAAGMANGFETHLVLGGKKPLKATGNLLLDELFGAVMHHVDSADWDVWEQEGKELRLRLQQMGKKVYWLPVGGSTPVGAIGYVHAFLEIMNDSRQLGLEFDSIIHASSSGGTQAGLIIGKELSMWQGRIIGMGVAKHGALLAQQVASLAQGTAEQVGITFGGNGGFVEDHYIGMGYAARTPECDAAIELFAREEGILLDRVYTGKAAAGLIDYARKEVFPKGSSVLFLHTGGNIELFE
jgi:D-cysteine desulfhydrase family pyridoxal phosphate-dependent enzyme